MSSESRYRLHDYTKHFMYAKIVSRHKPVGSQGFNDCVEKLKARRKRTEDLDPFS
jgi:hypothetical protein